MVDQCIPIFHMEPKRDGAASAEAGRPMFKEIPFVQILIPGNDKDIINRQVKDEDKIRWPEQWAAFSEKGEATIQGTPMEKWPALDVAEVAMFRALNILTVEQLANLDDQGLQKLGMSGSHYKKKAEVYIATAADEGFVFKQMEELEKANQDRDAAEARFGVMEAEIAALKAQIAPSDSQVEDQGPETPKKKRGRPPKEKAA